MYLLFLVSKLHQQGHVNIKVIIEKSRGGRFLGKPAAQVSNKIDLRHG